MTVASSAAIKFFSSISADTGDLIDDESSAGGTRRSQQSVGERLAGQINTSMGANQPHEGLYRVSSENSLGGEISIGDLSMRSMSEDGGASVYSMMSLMQAKTASAYGTSSSFQYHANKLLMDNVLHG